MAKRKAKSRLTNDSSSEISTASYQSYQSTLSSTLSHKDTSEISPETSIVDYSNVILTQISQLGRNHAQANFQEGLRRICDQTVVNRMNGFKNQSSLANPVPISSNYANYTNIDLTNTRKLKAPLKDCAVVHVTGDGNCYYYALAQYLFKNPKFAMALRLLAVLAVLNHWIFFENLCRKHQFLHIDDEANGGITSMPQLINNLSTSGSWATTEAIYATCLALER